MKVLLHIIAFVFDALAAVLRFIGDAVWNMDPPAKEPEMDMDSLWVDMNYHQAAKNAQRDDFI